ncbi:hypothetical protein AvCA_33620 [Azotobacter vinelandii CA]|uniref:Uncharacterized protein n=2 Tax=Azotobacter vinelandii TaxID=354 RepID=C1DPU1_AZOVD|nr:hypothetical protein Avin_33620 [Azotobacter vinelandii DJ]AGK16349.1 hypothetical protein AvCA_33620 [Azotobacter vinelandii CA]AGK21283.1 hypothetical protein AvCA6_33620 [Azotobacter vinelandii CA6]
MPGPVIDLQLFASRRESAFQYIPDFHPNSLQLHGGNPEYS